MENVSNALLMAATMLVFLILASIGIYLYTQYGSYSKKINDSILAKQEYEFNVKFTKYDTLDTCKAHDVITLVNLAIENNQKFEDYNDAAFPGFTHLKEDWPYYISIKVSGCSNNDYNKTNFERLDKDKLINFIKDNDIDSVNHNVITFTCHVTVHDDIKRPYLVEFVKNP